MTDDEMRQAAAAMSDPNTAGLFFAMLAILSGLFNQKVFNREQMIDFLLEIRADQTPEERLAPSSQFLMLTIRYFERSQFPE